MTLPPIARDLLGELQDAEQRATEALRNLEEATRAHQAVEQLIRDGNHQAALSVARRFQEVAG